MDYTVPFLFEADKVKKFVHEYCETSNPIDLMRLDILYSQDKLCDKCITLPDNEMLCGGIRLVLDYDSTTAYSKPVLIDHACAKLELKQEQLEDESKMKGTGIPIYTYKEILRSLQYAGDEYDLDHEGSVFKNDGYDANTYDRLIVAHQSLKNIRHAMEIVVGLAENFWDAQFFYVDRQYTKVIEWDTEKLSTLDFVHFEGVNTKGGTDFSRQKLFEIIKMRIANEAPTSISLLENTVGRTEEEENFFQELRGKIN
jgi:hypothetical protein